MPKNPGLIALKYVMCSKTITAKDAVAIKYLMCSRPAEELMKKGKSVSIKYLMCSRPVKGGKE